MTTRISSQTKQEITDCLTMIVTYDIDGFDHGETLTLRAEVVNVRIGGLDFDRYQAMELFTNADNDGVEYVQRLEEEETERALERYRSESCESAAARFDHAYDVRAEGN